MEQRINDLCEALRQFLLGIIPMAAGIQDDLQAMVNDKDKDIDPKFTANECRCMIKELGELLELNNIGQYMHEIRYLVGRLQPFESAALNSSGKKTKTPSTAEDALKSLQGLSAEDIAKLLGGLK